jgi:hypothetical protein
MSGLIGQGVTLRGFYDDNWSLTFNITGVVNRATDMGKLMSLDTTADDAAKLSVADSAPLGVLLSYEDRKQEGIKTGAVALKGGYGVPYTGALTVGASIVGSATPGVAKAAAAGSNRTIVTSVDAVNGIATVLFL